MLSAPAGNIDEASTSHKAQSTDNCISETTDLKVLSSPLTVDGNTLTEMRSWDFQNTKQHETTWFSVSEFWGPPPYWKGRILISTCPRILSSWKLLATMTRVPFFQRSLGSRPIRNVLGSREILHHIIDWMIKSLIGWLDDWMIRWAGNKKRLHCRTISIEANTLPLPKWTFQSDIWCLAKRACEFGVLCSEFGLRQATTCYHKHVAKGQETQQIITNPWFCTQMW